MLTVNIPHVLVFCEHAMLFLLELLFQGYHQYAQFRGSFIIFVHASFVEPWEHLPYIAVLKSVHRTATVCSSNRTFLWIKTANGGSSMDTF